ncbi:MAG: hypothetical protein EU535_00880 [Promethearchaeota archaeon]|nr:MAG: hypothetical protein EU535_00880 [Candidatus Lokiarchaeota archaeon]
MKIFEWIEDIEKVYDDLIEKAKKKATDEIDSLREDQEKIMEDLESKKQHFVNSTLKNLSEDITNGINDFKSNLEKTIGMFENKFQEYEKKEIKTILGKLGFDF